MGMHPKTSAALQELIAQIRAGYIGSDGYMPSINQLAALLNIGRGAVPSLLTELARQGITDCASGRHIRILPPAPENEAGARRRILIADNNQRSVEWIVNHVHDAMEIFQVYRGILAAAEENHVELIPGFQPRTVTAEGTIYRCKKEGIHGIICLEYIDPVLLNEARASGIPLVVANLESDVDVCGAGMDFRQIGRIAGRLLTAKGHRRIGFLSSVRAPWIYREMLAGLRGALAEEEIPLPRNMCFTLDNRVPEQGIARLQELLCSRGRPTAFFCGRDRIAALLYAAANRCGLRIPEDFSILSYDNLTWRDGRYFGLSSIEQPAMQIGRAALELILRCQPGEPEPESILLEPGPVLLRESLAEAPRRIATGIRN